MLQQTQVSTVIPYFQRFIAAFPTVESLATATEDQVLHHWTGLGYYSRARNMQRTAKIVTESYSGNFPKTVEELAELPGIGKSTAGAIVAIAHRQRATILDGNVKRVLARYHSIAGWPGASAVLKELWAKAEQHAPTQRIADYTQAIMDLGATVCTPTPNCELCPFNLDCSAHINGNPRDFPGKKPKKTIPVKATTMLLLENQQGELLLEKRPSQGVWGGLWVFPQINDGQHWRDYCDQTLRAKAKLIENRPVVRHTFSHYHLDITPVHIELTEDSPGILEAERLLWYNIGNPAAIGLAAPVKKILGTFPQQRISP